MVGLQQRVRLIAEMWNKQVRQITEAMEHTFRWGIYERAPLKTWSTERITLLGDAAHAVTPHLGQGATRRSRTQSPSPCCSRTHKPATFRYGCAVTQTYVSNGLVRSMTAPERPGRCTVRPNCRQASKPNGSSLLTTDCNSTPTT